MNKRKTKIIILLAMLFSVGFTIYASVIIIKHPLIGIEVSQKSGKWIVDEIHREGWAANHPIEKEDIVALIDKKKVEEHPTVILFDRIEKAESITFLIGEAQIDHYTISYENANESQILLVLIPLIFNAVMILLSLFLYMTVKIKRDVIILIYFLLSIGICYLGAFLSARGDLFLWFFTGVTLSSSIVLLMHFFKEYFLKYHAIFISATTLKTLYILNLLIVLIVFIDQVSFNLLDTKRIELLYFLILILILIAHLIRFYIGQRNSKGKAVMKILGLTVFFAFGPFIFFYVTPRVFLKEALISAEFASIFLMIIPISLVYLLLAEKLFDIDFMFNRLRYYFLLAVPTSILIVLFTSFIPSVPLDLTQLTLISILIFIGVTFLLYIKEYLDYKFRHHLFSQKGNLELSLYTFFQKAKHEMKASNFVHYLQKEIKDVLSVKDIFYSEIYTENQGESWSLKNEEGYSLCYIHRVERINWIQSDIGSLIEVSDGYGIVIGGNHHLKKVILFGMKDSKVNLNIQERIWLEALAYFSSILLENFLLIEELVGEIEHYKDGDHYPPWLSRLLFALAERERANLSIDLHDSVLQNQLQLLREIDQVSAKVTDANMKDDLSNLKERMLDNIYLVRDTCNELQPPFLNELGVIESVQNLINLTKLRCSFDLTSELDHSIHWLDREVELTLYRVVQELLNNAMEHSQAMNVDLKIQKNDLVITLIYKDDGIGFDLETLQNSFKTMGLFGIRERIRSIGGRAQINSVKGEGLSVFVEVSVEGIND